MSTEEVKTNTNEETKHEHVHGENCDHEHGHDGEDKKGAKGEKKVRKALGKLGMTKVEGVNRVTIRQKDNYILVVKDPEVFTSAQTENTYIIFGELTMDDPEKKFDREALEKMKNEGEKLKTENAPEKKDNVQIVDEGEEDTGEDLDPTAIDTVMKEGNCSRAKAVKALRANDKDVVSAILNLNQ